MAPRRFPRLGKLPARRGAIKLKFGDFFDPKAIATPPKVFGHQDKIARWGMLANDEYGCCVFSGSAHETMLWTEVGAAATARFSTANVLADYANVTGFNPKDRSTDNGTDMQAAASYRRKVGVIDAVGKRHLIDSYLALKIGDPDQLALATFLTSAVGIGLQLPDYAMDQFDAGKPWTVKSKGSFAGGHYAPVIGRLPNGNFACVTWGKIQEIAPAFYQKYSDENVTYVSLELFSNSITPEGFDADQLRAQLSKLSTPSKRGKAA